MEQNTMSNTNPAAGERTFTQDEVNHIVGERLAKEKAKQDASFAEREQQFAERERELARREAFANTKYQIEEMGLPSELLPVLNVQDQEAMDKALQALKNHIHAIREEENSHYKVFEPHRLPQGKRYTYDSDNAKLREAMGLKR